MLDVSGNAVECFPAEVRREPVPSPPPYPHILASIPTPSSLQLLQIPLMEFHYEENPLVPFIPVPSDLHQEVLMLKELAGREVLEQLRGRWVGHTQCHLPADSALTRPS